MAAPALEPIAVVGTGCRFPGESSNPSKLWDLLKEPRDVLRHIDRFNADNFHHDDGHHHGASNVRDAYLLTEDPTAFDAQFFSISAGEADNIDPQHRVLLETVYEGVESAGMSLESLQGSQTAVFVGVMCDDYTDILYYDGEAIPTYAATGSARSILSNRISYFFDWHGPSMTIDTACSSSLIAVHQAVQVLRSGQSHVAVAGGANLIFGPKMFMAESNLNMLSATGRSQMWDANANGYARGEGVAAVVMKTLSSAIADGDHIECIIRETGINQDGRTMGITMPSSTAQAQLIADTYARAGLDPLKPTERCQYFEAHGTGTKAGDPQEARAIHQAFFGQIEGQDSENTRDPDDVLRVGSIKTIVGHTEGTAGLAGLIKASLAIQNKVIPPNLLFQTLNPDIEPFYGPLQIPQTAMAWPTLPPGVPRRASINSFGFGGANAHAIIENYEPNDHKRLITTADNFSVVPYLFSATSEKSLKRQLENYARWIDENPEFPARDLSLTMTRRSAFSYRTSVSATSLESLKEKIETKLNDVKPGTNLSTRPIKDNRRILGIFTGQGAQWAEMGKDLIHSSEFVAQIFSELELSLATLPEADRPSWKLTEELCRDAETSKIGEAALSQPLCTAVQVALVDLFDRCGVHFSSVAGHSSGEIGAAYAAGLISARDAIRIAYYRGLFAKYAQAPNGEKGLMMAVGTSMEDAEELCTLPPFPGRLNVAASNSSASVTMSGDADAIDHAGFIFEDESKFVRKLKVDTAYHSHHMLPCSSYYLDALAACEIKIMTPAEDAPAWYSSVIGEKMTVEHSDELAGPYWMKNMLQPVLFSQALVTLLEDTEEPALAIEVGPHPALKGPASLTIEETIKHGIPYLGSLCRGKNDTESFSESLGSLWAHLQDSKINFRSFDSLFSQKTTFALLKDLPSYVWDKDRTYWYESRAHKASRLRKDPLHELLGIRLPEDVEGEYRWRNFVKPIEIPWLRGHEIQGQKLFPAAGFAAMAFEASRSIVPATDVRLLELQDLIIHRAMAFNDEYSGVETIVKLSRTRHIMHGQDKVAIADYECLACPSKDSGIFNLVASARVKITLGTPNTTSLPARAPAPPVNLSNVAVDEFYTSLNNVGYNYTECFRGITELRRAKDVALGAMLSTSELTSQQQYYIHPGPLDVAFQSIFAAISSPGDGSLWTIHVPTVIKRIQINPAGIPSGAGLDVTLPFSGRVASKSSSGISGDMIIYDTDSQHSIVQVDGLHVTPLSSAQVSNDRRMFCQDSWGNSLPEAEMIKDIKEWKVDNSQRKAWSLVERACLFYLNSLHNSITDEEREDCDEAQIRLLEWANQVIQLTDQGKHPVCKPEWLEDTEDDIKTEIESAVGYDEELNHIVTVGEMLVPFLRCEASMESFYNDDDKLETLYANAAGRDTYHRYLGDLVNQLAYRHQNSNMLQIGAGEGTAAQAVLEAIGDNFASYTYTDGSEFAVSSAQERSKERGGKIIYKTVDVEGDIASQGLAPAAYDIVIAAETLHKTTSLQTSLKNARSLLKPGGWLVILENTQAKSLYTNFIFSGLNSWWNAAEEVRQYTPLLDPQNWDLQLKETGFSGIDTATADPGTSAIPFTVMVTQAVDQQMNLIRNPLSLPATKPLFEELVVVGGETFKTARLRDNILQHIQCYCEQVTLLDRIDMMDESNLSDKSTVLCLAEFDEPLFKPFTPAKLKALQILVSTVKTTLWVTQGARGEQPYAVMIKGLQRCWFGEYQTLKFQSLDFDHAEKVDARVVSENLLRMSLSAAWKKAGAAAYSPTWPIETEYHYSKGMLHVPRLEENQVLNDRYNARNRTVRRPVSLDNENVALVKLGSRLEVQEERTDFMTANNNDFVSVRVKFSTSHAFRIRDVGHLYAVIGVTCDTKQKVLTFSDRLLSTVRIPRTWTVPCNIDDQQGQNLLSLITSELLADSILRNAQAPDSILVHEARPLIAQALRRRASEQEVHIALTTCTENMEGYTYMHPESADQAIQDHVPTHLTTFVTFSENPDFDRLGHRLAELLPSHTRQIQGSRLVFDRGYTHPGKFNDAAASKMREMYKRALQAPKELKSDFPEVSLIDVPHMTAPVDSLATIAWRAENVVSTKILTSEAGVEFRSDRTYLLVGLAGDLGLSLCRWMVEHGAKHIALTSRNPKVSQDWLNLMERKGASIKIYCMDVTEKASVDAALEVIRSTMPKIAGVANGAMVLIDHLFNTTTFEDFETTLRPKVDGTIILDEAFPDNDLDFFICFSSLAFVSGNLGQTSYAAANGFMSALVNGRRKRGLAGSVIHMTGILGLGYVERTDRKIVDFLTRYGFVNLSEWDFHQYFAEAVVSGRPSSGLSPEIASSMLTFDPEKDALVPAWIDIPRFSHFKLIKPKEDAAESGTQNRHHIRPLLAEATTQEQVHEILLDGLRASLARQLQLPSPDDITPEQAVVELGVDSLVAVDLRAWFTKELDVDMPVLKILGGATLAEIVDDTAKRISRDLIPKVAGEETAAEKAEGESSEDNENGEETAEGSPTEAVDSEEGNLDEDATLVAGQSSDTEGDSESASYSSPILSPAEGSSSSVTSADLDDTEIFDKSEALEGVTELDSDASNASEEATIVKKAPMSYGSSRFWFLDQYLSDPTTFNLCFRMKIVGEMDTDKLAWAVKEIGKRHEVFRSAFYADTENMNEATIGVFSKSSLELEQIKIGSDEEAEEETRRILEHQFDLEHGEIIRIKKMSIGSNTHYMVFATHHMAFDGFSFNVLIYELSALYGGTKLPAVETQFSDFGVQQRKLVESGKLDTDFNFWKKEYTTFPEPLPLFPVAKVLSRPNMVSYDFEQAMITLDSTTTRMIRDQSRRYKSTPFHFFLAVFKTFLFRYLETEDLAIGMADANRTDNNLVSTIGFLLNLLPLRFKADPAQSFNDAVTEVRNKAYEAISHSKLPFDVLLEKLQIPRSSTHTPIFQAFIDYLALGRETPTTLGAVSEGWSSVGRTGYDIVLDVNERPGENFKVSMRCQKSLYSSEATQMIFDSFLRVLKSFSVTTKLSPTAVPLHDAIAVRSGLKLGRARRLDSEWPETVSRQIDAAIDTRSDVTAVKDGNGNKLTYHEMGQRVNSICQGLISADLGSNPFVAVFQEPGADWICSLLAIWKIGGTYIPLDGRSGLPRLANIVEGAQPQAIICDARTLSDCPALQTSAKIVNVADVPSEQSSAVINQSDAEKPAVIQFTSGSTGIPKGIVLLHSNIRNWTEASSKAWHLGPETVLQHSAFTFDLSLDQILLALTHGGTLFVASKAQRESPAEMAKIILDEGITYTMATPSEYSTWIEYGSEHLKAATRWTSVWGGGEAMTKALVRDFKNLGKPSLRLYNAWGPSEVTFSCTKCEIDWRKAVTGDDEIMPIGVPLPNYSVRVVDKNLEPVPVGISGEILVGGAGVAQGYLHNEELTKASFIDDKNVTPEYARRGWTKLYRTGDQGYLRSDGVLVFQKRIGGDTQIKLRGIRVELGDIEASIIKASDDKIIKCVATARGDPKFLVAHVKFAAHIAPEEQKQYANELLARLPVPSYMRPAVIIPLDEFPFNAHNKTDRRAIAELPLPQDVDDEDSNGDMTSTESALRDLWLEIVSPEIAGVVKIRSHTDFFQAGGNSLLLVKLQVLIRQTFNAAIPMTDLYQSGTLKAMASKIEGGRSAAAIDWNQEISVQEELNTLQQSKQLQPPGKDNLTVLMTGAHGFLGKAIVQQLIADDRVSSIHCLAVRQQGDEQTRAAPLKSSKLIVHQGDFSQPRLGLSEEVFELLAQNADLIVHSGANRSFWDQYHLLKNANVTPTKELGRLASLRKIPIHFLSSGGVLDLASEDVRDTVTSMHQFQPPTDGSLGYIASKWASEVYLEEVAKATGVPVHIHRVTRAPEEIKPTREIVEDFARAALEMESMPLEGSGWGGTFELIKLDRIATMISTTALEAQTEEQSVSSDPPTFFHHYAAEARLRLAELMEDMEQFSEITASWQRLQPEIWVGEAKKNGLSYHLASMDFKIERASGESVSIRR